jgi:hypothetical protein
VGDVVAVHLGVSIAQVRRRARAPAFPLINGGLGPCICWAEDGFDAGKGHILAKGRDWSC